MGAAHRPVVGGPHRIEPFQVIQGLAQDLPGAGVEQVAVERHTQVVVQAKLAGPVSLFHQQAEAAQFGHGLFHIVGAIGPAVATALAQAAREGVDVGLGARGPQQGHGHGHPARVQGQRG